MKLNNVILAIMMMLLGVSYTKAQDWQQPVNINGAHRTQVDPEGFWMRIPDDAVRRVFPWEEYLLARSLVDTGVADGDTEDDLFAGIRADNLAPRV